MKPEQTTINSLAEAIEVAKSLLDKSPDDIVAQHWVSKLTRFIAALGTDDKNITVTLTYDEWKDIASEAGGSLAYWCAESEAVDKLDKVIEDYEKENGMGDEDAEGD